MGLPLFENPHLLPQSTEPAARAELYPSYENSSANLDASEDEHLVQSLNKVVRKRVRYEIAASTSTGAPSAKRRKLSDAGGQEDEEQDDPLVLFRLVSSLKDPMLVSLLPAPSPPTLTRPPDAEDTEAQALLREQRAKAASVDGEQILRHATISMSTLSLSLPLASARLREDIAGLPDIIVLESTQRPRKTRPPVPPSTMLYHPYTALEPPPSAVAVPKFKCPVATIDDRESTTTSIRRRSRHRRQSKLLSQPPKERPPPQFWRPSPGMTGKCRGYAFGYPGSFLAAAEARGYVDPESAKKYKHDTMKKGKYIE